DLDGDRQLCHPPGVPGPEEVDGPALLLAQAARSRPVERRRADAEGQLCLQGLVRIQDVAHDLPPFSAVILRTSTTTHECLAGTGCVSALVIPLNFTSRLSAGTIRVDPSTMQLLTGSRSSQSTGCGAPVSTWKNTAGSRRTRVLRAFIRTVASTTHLPCSS